MGADKAEDGAGGEHAAKEVSRGKGVRPPGALAAGRFEFGFWEGDHANFQMCWKPGNADGKIPPHNPGFGANNMGIRFFCQAKIKRNFGKGCGWDCLDGFPNAQKNVVVPNAGGV